MSPGKIEKKHCQAFIRFPLTVTREHDIWHVPPEHKIIKYNISIECHYNEV